MTTYSVHCGHCGREMLFEQPEPMDDPGQLSAFCSTECSVSFGKAMFQEMVDAGMGVIVELECGCLACVHGIEGSGSIQPWYVCEEARGQGYIEHGNEIQRQAVEFMRRRN